MANQVSHTVSVLRNNGDVNGTGRIGRIRFKVLSGSGETKTISFESENTEPKPKLKLPVNVLSIPSLFIFKYSVLLEST